MDFLEKINEISPISGPQWSSLSESLKPLNLPRGEALLKTGEQASHIAFIIEGSVRLYYLTRDGKEYNQSFKFEGELVAGYASLLTQRPCQFTIEAMEETKVILLPFIKMTELYEKDPCWERLGRMVAEQHFLNKEEREASFLLLDAKARYQKLLKDKPEIEKRVPQYHIASFLGITASAFNRLIKEI